VPRFAVLAFIPGAANHQALRRLPPLLAAFAVFTGLVAAASIGFGFARVPFVLILTVRTAGGSPFVVA
jgi:hypothetical protein